jgi:hypothetical protein
MGRLGTALLAIVLLSTVVSAEPERPCPACGHGMARVEGQEAGEADYVCRFCEVAVHVEPDGREMVSYRIQGERHEFDLLGDDLLTFPLPGEQPPEGVIIPVSEAALAAAPGAGHPVTLPGHPVELPGVPVPVPTAAPVTLPSHPIELPGHPVELPTAPVELPDHPVSLPGFSITIPRHPVGLSGTPVVISSHPIGLPGSPVGLPGHPIALGGQVVTLPRAPVASPAPRTVEPTPVTVTVNVHDSESREQSRFFGRPPMASVLRGFSH